MEKWYYKHMETQEHPIIIGLCGKAGTGKTSVANLIVPSRTIKNDAANGIIWDHTFFALPLYEMASIKRMTKGELSQERILFQMHEVLLDLFGRSPAYGAPSYDDFIQVVKDISDIPMPINDDIKPRSFLQEAGKLCRDKNEDCFVQWAKRRSYQRAASLLSSENDENETYQNYACIISDVRYVNEAEMIASHPNGILIRFDASNDIRMDRLYNRDGYRMSEEQLNHKSERVEDIPEEWFDAVVNSDTMNVKQQAEATELIIRKQLGRVYA
jgi:dephospho-CoA kinase